MLFPRWQWVSCFVIGTTSRPCYAPTPKPRPSLLSPPAHLMAIRNNSQTCLNRLHCTWNGWLCITQQCIGCVYTYLFYFDSIRSSYMSIGIHILLITHHFRHLFLYLFQSAVYTMSQIGIVWVKQAFQCIHTVCKNRSWSLSAVFTNNGLILWNWTLQYTVRVYFSSYSCFPFTFSIVHVH